MQGGEAAGEDAVELFGKGLLHVAGAKAGFDMADRHARVEGGESAVERGVRVALDVDDIGTGGGEDGFHAGEDARGRGGERLARGHGVQVVIGGDAEDGEGLIQHFAVLAGDGDLDVEVRGPGPHVKDDRGELDGFRAGAENKKSS